MHEWGGLTRFASNSIHQSTHREDTGIRVRVVTEARIGVAASNDFSLEGARRAAESALEMASVVAPDPMFPGLAPPAPTSEHHAFDEPTASTTPDQRAEAVAELVAHCPQGFTAAGAYETLASEVAVANTDSQFCWAPSSQASINTVVTGSDGGSGFAEVFAAGTDELDPAAIGKRAAERRSRRDRPATSTPVGTRSSSSRPPSRRSSGSSRGSGSGDVPCSRDARASRASRTSRSPLPSSRSTTTPCPTAPSVSPSTSKACRDLGWT